MYHRILIATDGSELANKGLAHGVALAKALGAQLAIVTASEPWTPIGVDATGIAVTEYALSDEYEAAARTAATKILEDARQSAAAAGLDAKTVYVRSKYPADAIIETADSEGSDLVVMASHGRRGVGRLLLGSQANEVLTRSKVPVLIVR